MHRDRQRTSRYDTVAPSMRASTISPSATSIVTGGVNSSRPPLVKYTRNGGSACKPRVLRVIHAPAERLGHAHTLIDERLPADLCREKQPATDGHGEQDENPGRDEGRVPRDLVHCGPRPHQNAHHAAHQNFLC